MTELPKNDMIIDAWIVQLDSLIKHAKHFKSENIRKYKGKQHEAFDAGLSMMILLMEAMIKDMLPKKDISEYLPEEEWTQEQEEAWAEGGHFLNDPPTDITQEEE